MTYHEVIEQLKLRPLPGEGGAFARIYEHDSQLPGPRRLGSSIYYLLHGTERSAWHRVKSGDELWFWHGPARALQLIVAPDFSTWQMRILGMDVTHNEQPQAVVPAAWHQSTRLLEAGADTFSLFSTVVIPEFQDSDFSLSEESELCEHNPALADILRRFDEFRG